MNTTVPLLIGALIGFIGSFGAAMLTSRTNSIARERDAYAPILRKLHELNVVANRTPAPEELSAHTERLDDLAMELDVLRLPLMRRADRDDLAECVTALLEREQRHPQVSRAVMRATGLADTIVKTRANRRFPLFQRGKRPGWVANRLEEFRKQAALEQMIQEENEKSYQAWAEEERQKKK